MNRRIPLPSPFDTAEIPVSRRRDYESAEDAPAVRKELDENLLHLTTACIVSGAAALVLLVLAFIAAALPAMPGVLAGETVYPAVALVLLAAAARYQLENTAERFAGSGQKADPRQPDRFGRSGCAAAGAHRADHKRLHERGHPAGRACRVGALRQHRRQADERRHRAG